MKIGIITDLHMDFYKEKADEFEKFMESLRVDILICAGDWTCNHIKQAEVAFKIIRKVDPYLKVLTVKGNHGFWCSDSFTPSLDEYIEEFNALMKKYNIHYLEDNPYEDEGIIFFGYDGWYNIQSSATNDYTMIPERNSMGAPTFQYMKRKEQLALYNIVDDVVNYPNHIKVCVTHFNFHCDPGYEHLIGNPRHFTEFLKDNFDYVITGHSHQYMNQKFDNCTIINPGADYDQCPRLDLFYEELVINKKED